MKGKKRAFISIGLALMLSLGICVGCGGGKGENLGSKPIGNRTVIQFYCDANLTSDDAWIDLITAYNDGTGYDTDQVYVQAKLRAGASSSAANEFTKSAKYANNVVAINDSQDAFQTLAIKRDNNAPNGYFVDLSSYAAADADFQNAIPDRMLDWWRMTFNANAKEGAGQPKHVVGAGQKLLGVPYGTNSHFNWYNRSLFTAQGINLISVPEENLDAYNTEHGSSLKPHGYAEYKTAPYATAKPSETLDGRTVYKVFNDCIGVNWEEMRYLLKYFTKSYNSSSSSTYGFCSEYWFNYGWSVGGDVMGFNGTDYDFTLTDKRPNYIVTKDGTVINGVTYNAGQIVRYEDRVNGIEKASDKPTDIYAIESQYNAVKEYVSLQVAASGDNSTVDKRDDVTFKGYGVATPETDYADNYFNTSYIAMVRGTPDSIVKKENETKFDICLPETYREYEGGSVYYSGGNDFAHEYLKVIGEKYDANGAVSESGTEYTGDLKVVGDAKIVGSSATASITQGLVIPACSDPAKYQAAWDFISWVATEGQKYIAYTKTLAPIAKETLYGNDYMGNENVAHGKNLYAVAKMSENACRGDWGYFENGQWVTDWSNDFNGSVRKGTMTLSSFTSAHSAGAKNSLNNMYCVIKGIR